MRYKLQYMGLGGILDQAIAITKDHFGLLFMIMLVLVIPFELISGYAEFGLTPSIPDDPTREDWERYQEIQQQNLPALLAIRGVGFIYSILILPLANASVINAVAHVYLGRSVTAFEAIKDSFRKLGPLIGTWILMYLAIFGGLILFIIPGILFALWFALSQHVVVIEGIAGRAALSRSKKLVRNHLGTLLMLGLVMFMISFLLYIPLALLTSFPYISLALYALIQALTTILWTAAGVVFYFSCRCAEENFDLHHLAEAIAVEPATVDAVAPAGQRTV